MEEIMITHLTIDELKAMLRVEMQLALAAAPPVGGTPQEDLLTSSSACELLNLAQSTLYKLVHLRAIPCMKRGNKLYFSKKELVRWVAEGRQATRVDIDREAQAFLDNRPPLKRD